MACLLCCAGMGGAGCENATAGELQPIDDEERRPGDEDEENAEPPAPPPEPWSPPDDFLQFSDSCVEGEQITIAAVGDVLIHRELQGQAFATEERFRGIWSKVSHLLSQADITYANLEGPMAPGINRVGRKQRDPGMVFDGKVYSGFAFFNYHPSLALDLAADGVDIVSTANNHALDRGPLGVERTIASLQQAGLKHSGTRLRDRERDPFHVVTETKGISIAWLACTMHTNDLPDPGHQVLPCQDDENVTEVVRELAGRAEIDAVLVTPHWGKAYIPEPALHQSVYAHRWLEAGALAVLGGHPHVLQPWEKYETADGRETFVIYSLGNFVSHHIVDLQQGTAIVLYLGLTRDDSGRTRINGVRYVPLHMREEDKIFHVMPTDCVEDAQVNREIALATYGEANLMHFDEELVTNPACDPLWRPGLQP